MKRTNIIILTILGIAAAIGAIVLIRRTNAQGAEPNPGGTVGNGNASGGGSVTPAIPGGNINPAPSLNYNVTLKLTSGIFTNQAEVKTLQLILNKVETAQPLVVDGKFGPLTEAKLKRLNGGYGQITLAQAKLKWPY